MPDPDYDLLDSQLRALLCDGDELGLGPFQPDYLTRETYSRDRVSTLITSC